MRQSRFADAGPHAGSECGDVDYTLPQQETDHEPRVPRIGQSSTQRQRRRKAKPREQRLLRDDAPDVPPVSASSLLWCAQDLGGEHPRTLDEVGRAFNVTRERIRQIESQSLKKLQLLDEAQNAGEGDDPCKAEQDREGGGSFRQRAAQTAPHRPEKP